MSGKQKTLFQTWGSCIAPHTRKPKESKPTRGKVNTGGRGESVSRGGLHPAPVPARQPPPTDDDDDDVLLVAVYEAEKSLNEAVTRVPQNARLTGSHGLDTTPFHGQLWDLHHDPSSTHVQTLPEDGYNPLATRDPGHDPTVTCVHDLPATHVQNLPGFDLSAGHVWIYPTNLPVRNYQFNIAYTALLHNTLVCLPTGLGKTFIAAVVMYNFYRWYPSGKIVFMAPTKPLVAQQIEACFRVMGIPQRHMAEMTGSTQAQNRKEIWLKCRVFFLTPQVMVNDLSRGACPASEIKCLVIDEAHKALGNHAYCQVVRELSNYTTQFRILALSATPGSDAKSVQHVVSNLLIAQIELRSEDSPDIQPYSHVRQLEKLVVPLGDELEAVQKSYLQVLETFAGRLIRNNVLSRRDIPNLTKYQIVLSRDQFRKNPPSNIVGVQQGVVEGDFALCISLFHGYELLLQMGTRSLYCFLRAIMDGSKGMTRARNELGRNGDFMELYQELENTFSGSRVTGATGSPPPCKASLGSDVKKTFIYSHPKLKKLEEVVVQHFKSWTAHEGQSTSIQTPTDTRVMIFSSFRDSVQEIAEMLNQHHPTVRVMTFMGHSSTGKNVKGFTQKEQLEVVKRFREGGYNTLVSTCVGEEGLDIGEVDLIVCFDAQKSPIRLVQRMGRTGRKRQGRIVVILSKGREERTYNQSQSSKRSIYNAILGNDKVLHFNLESPRMVPDGINPKVHKMYVTQGTFESKDNTRPFSKDRRSNTTHRKSSLFFNGEVKDTMKEDWSLTHTEFETWNRIYRLQESDGVKDVILPKSHFACFRDTDPVTEAPPGKVRELSLTEWKVWQNRPFPTHFVPHSDRCKNFIAIMEMIELMRHEEDGCSYDLEMMSYLHKEDVDRSTKPTGNNVVHSASNPKAAKKGPHSKKGKRAKVPSSSSFLEPDEECLSLFKASNFKRITKLCSVDVGNAEPMMDVSRITESDTTEVECIEDECPVDLDQDICMGNSEPRAPALNCDLVSDLGYRSPSHLEEAVTTSRLIARTKADSGFHSFSEETSSVLSNAFYTLQSQMDYGVFAEFADDKNCELENIRSCIKVFLSRSPPPISELDDLDNILMHTGDTHKQFYSHHSIIDTASEKQCLLTQPLPSIQTSHNPKEIQVESNPMKHQDCLGELMVPDIKENQNGKSVGFPVSDVLIDLHKSVSADSPTKEDVRLKESCSKGSKSKDPDDGTAENDTQWDDIFDCDSEETEMENVSLSQPSSPVQVKDNLGSGHIEEQKTTIDALPEHLDDSFNLFEDDPFTDFDNYSQVNSKTSNKQKILDDETSVTFNLFDPFISLNDPVDTEQEPETRVCSASDNVWQQVDNEETFDCSEELFSVNFDLGFSIEDDELSESEGALNRRSEIECEKEAPTKHFKVPSPPDRSNMSVIGGNASTPVTSIGGHSTLAKMSEKHISVISPLQPVKGKNCVTPEKSMCSSFLTPPGEKCKNPKTPIASISKYELMMPVTPKARGGKGNSQTASSSRSWDVGRSEIKQPKRKSDLAVPNNSLIKGSDSDSDDEVVYRGKRKLATGNVLRSPEAAGSDGDFDSPIPAAKKRKNVFNTPDSCGDEGKHSAKPHSTLRSDHCTKPPGGEQGLKANTRTKLKCAAKQFFDDEAELSSEGAEYVSSDENVDSDNERDSSLIGFLNDNTQLSQGLNDSEMHGVYLKSVRSPAVRKHFKTAHRKKNNMAIFSQIPEQDESYMEDSFCVEGDDEEEENEQESSEEEVQVNLDLLQQDSFVGGRKQYCTRRRLNLKEVRTGQSNDIRPEKKKVSRIIIHDDSSEEERGGTSGVQVNSAPVRTKLNSPLTIRPSVGGPSIQNRGPPTTAMNTFDVRLRDRCQARINLKASVSEVLDFQPESRSSLGITNSRTSNGIVHPAHQAEDNANKPHSRSSWMTSSALSDLSFVKTQPLPGSTASKTALCILADSREISSGPDIISYLKTAHGVKVEVCSLGGCDYIVSNRMAVERKSQSEFANSTNKNKLVERIQHLQNVFERVCLIVEKDRVKPGDTSRIFQRTKYFDSTLSALISAGVRVLFSSSQEETAGLLKELTLLEQRKNAGIEVPTELMGPKQEVLQFYLSIPSISYLTALNLCHHFDSVKQMANSSVNVISDYAQVSPQKAEEIFRYVRYVFEAQMLTADNGAKRKKSL
ncbi:Fanconi anemia group M protein isoform X1 [Ascaphus truei]|uniref:Fanconi anemia group M protein isoform X1 n=1 Tax=Ascaphus truei TaxID=8439 RepID=UPI003F5958C7